MKKYIHAAYDASMPDWLRRSMSNKYSDLKRNLIEKFNIALDKVKFVDSKPANSLPVYQLITDYGKDIYIPGVNDNGTGYFNNRSRKFGSISKSTLPQYVADVVYIDLDDPDSKFAKKERYQDPRYTYRHSNRGDYAGQYKYAPYLGDYKYGPEKWSEAGKVPSNERRARDKSGYRVPSPEQKIADYYTKFPERITNKIDRVYDRMLEVRQELLAADFNKPLERGHYTDDISNAYNEYGRAVQYYRQLLDSLDEDRKLKNSRWSFDSEYAAKEFSSTISRIKDSLAEVEDYLNK